MGMGIGLLLGTVLSSLSSGDLSGSEAERMFRERCMSCHVAPDVQFEMDLAWLDQVKRTA